MTQRANAPVLLLFIIILISLALAGGGFFLFQQERQKVVSLEAKLEDVNTKQRIASMKLQESEKAISDLHNQLTDARLQIDTLQNDLEQERLGREDAEGRVEQLKINLQQQNSLRLDLEKKLEGFQQDADKMQKQLKELQSEKSKLEVKIEKLESGSGDVELGKIVVSPEFASVGFAEGEVMIKPAEEPAGRAVVSSGKPEGKILVVNKDYNFAVISLGNKDGVKLDDLFSVYHQGQYLGDVKVEKVHESMAAAGFVSAEIKETVSEGDQVIQKVK